METIERLDVPLTAQAVIATKWILIISGLFFWYVLGAVASGKQFGIPGVYQAAEAEESIPEFSPEFSGRSKNRR